MEHVPGSMQMTLMPRSFNCSLWCTVNIFTAALEIEYVVHFALPPQKTA
jgi:hypothetical protein